MLERDQRLMDLTAALSDGSPVDWDAVESSAASDSERRQIAELRLVGNIAAAQSAGEWSGGGVHDSLLHPTSAPESSPDSQPVTWGPLRVIEKIGRGRFGDVYRALEPRLDREVALKLLRHRETDPNLGAVVIEEGRLLAKVRHPNVVAVYGAERIDDRVGVWMELVRGRTLEDELAAGGVFDAARVADAGIGVCGALAAVHRAGLVHRDVKAQNVMRDHDGRLVLMDFGTGREIDMLDEPDLAGTPLYLAPEVLNGETPTTSADVYSVGVLLYHLAAGTFPVRGATLRDVKAAHHAGAPASTRRDLAALPALLAAAIERALSPDPVRRFATADDMAEALRAASPPRERARRLTIPAVAAGIVAALGLAALVTFWPSRGQSTEVLHVCEDCEAIGDPSVSVDGTRMAFTEPKGGDIAIRDLTTGRITPLQVRTGGWRTSSDLAMLPVLSRDGRFIAYAAIPQAQGRQPEIRVVEVKPGSPTRVLETGADLDLAIPLDWSPDGTSVLADLSHTTGAREIAWVSTSGGVTIVKRLASSMNRGQITAAVSPDGRHIAYGLVPNDNSRQSRVPLPPVQIVSADGRVEVPLSTAAAGWSSRPYWTPDGTRVLFISNLAGTVDAWSVPLSDGKPQSPPVMVRRDVGSAKPIGITHAGLYYFYESPAPVGHAHVWDIADGRGGSARVTRTLVGAKPTWSPDGKSVALVRRAPSNQDSNSLVVHELGTGAERLYEHQGFGSHLPLWLGDGTGLITLIREAPQQAYWYRLELASGTFTRLARNQGDPAYRTHWTIRALAPDGKTLYFGTYASPDPNKTTIDRIVSVDLATGRHTMVFRLPGAPDSLPQSASDIAIATSPDGRTVLLQTSHPETKQSIVATVAVDGSGYRVRYGPFEAPGTISEKLAWSADGRSLIFTMAGAPRAEGEGKQFRVMRLPVDAAEPVFTGVEADWMWSLAANPDATSVVFGGVATAGARSGVWALNLQHSRGSSK